MNTKVVKRKGLENRVGKLLAQILVHQCIHSFAAHLHTHQTKPPALKARNIIKWNCKYKVGQKGWGGGQE